MNANAMLNQLQHREIQNKIREQKLKESKNSSKTFTIFVKVLTQIPRAIPSKYQIYGYQSFPIPEEKCRMFCFTEKSAFEKFREYLRTIRASYSAQILPAPTAPYNVLKGF